MPEEIPYKTNAQFVQSCYIEHQSDNVILAFLETEKCFPCLKNIVFGLYPSCFICNQSDDTVYDLSFDTMTGYQIWSVNEWKEGIAITFYKKGTDEQV